MREVNVSIITDNIKEMCIEANHFLTDDMKNVFEKAVKNEALLGLSFRTPEGDAIKPYEISFKTAE